MQASLGVNGDSRAWQGAKRPDLEAAFRRARRHSRLVRTLRFALPGLVCAVFGLYTLLAFFNPFGALSGLPSISRLVISGTKITMDLPRLAGYTRDGRHYEIVASAASQDLKRPQLIELQEIRGRMQLQDGTVVSVTAEAGVYDSKSEAIALKPNVRVANSEGAEVRLNEARIDIRKGHIISEEPVEVLMSMGRIDARQMEITGSGEVIHFRGGVIVNIKAMEPSPKTSQAESRK